MDIPTSHLAFANLVLVLGCGLAVLGWLRARRQARRWRRELLTSEGRHRDEHRRLTVEIDRVSRARSTFLAAANHDLRQPLQALFCFSAILADGVRGHTRMVADQMQECLHALNGHLESLVELSRLDAGIVVPVPTTVSLDDVLSDLRGRFTPVAAAKGLRFRAVPPRCAACRSDPAMLRRILTNIIDNAVRFTDSGGVLVGCRRRGARVRIEIWDSGVGMTAEQLTHVFEEFYQVGNPQRDRANGLGLGLAVADRLVRLLPGHRLDVRSYPGHGSVFALELPAAWHLRPSAPVLRGPWSGRADDAPPPIPLLRAGRA